MTIYNIEDLIIYNKIEEKHKSSSEWIGTDKIELTIGKSIFYLSRNDIMYLRACGSYTELNTSQGTELFCKNLKWMSAQLDDIPLIRISRSYSINVFMIKEINKSAGIIIMKNKKKILIPRRIKKQKLKKIDVLLHGPRNDK